MLEAGEILLADQRLPVGSHAVEKGEGRCPDCPFKSLIEGQHDSKFTQW
jgi:hypothetical protein